MADGHPLPEPDEAVIRSRWTQRNPVPVLNVFKILISDLTEIAAARLPRSENHCSRCRLFR
jgi:hypothetical protein